MNRWLVVMAKEPRAGAVKTRLARDIGTVPATGFYRTSLSNLLRRVGMDTRWRTLVAVSPDTSLCSGAWPADSSVCPQGQGDLGARMQRVFDSLPPGPVIIIGTDIPEITPAHIAAAFQALGNADAVIGPGEDGGYWLIGLKRSPRIRAIFSGVRWSSANTLADTLSNLNDARVATLETLRDVDGGADWRALKIHASRVIPAAYKSS